MDGRISAIAGELENKKRAAGELAEVEGEMEQNREEVIAVKRERSVGSKCAFWIYRQRKSQLFQ